MSNLTFKFTKQSGKALHTSIADVHYVREITSEERAALSERYDHDTSAYQTTIRLFGSDKDVLAAETIEDFQAAGVAFVNIGGGKMTPAQNIGTAETFNKEDATQLEEKTSNKLTTTFRSRVTTPTGRTFLTVRHPSQIMESKTKALQALTAG